MTFPRIPGIRHALALALALALSTAAPAAAQSGDAAEPSGGIAVDASTTDGLRRDRAVAQRIREILAQLDGYANVSVEVRAGVVILSGRVAEPEQIQRLNDLVARVEGVVTTVNAVQETTDIAERLDPALARFERRFDQVVTSLPVLAVALAAFLAVFGSGMVLARLRTPWRRLAPNEFIADIYRQMVRVAFFLGAVVVALDLVGATALLGTFLGAAGIVGLAIGFAVRDTVENFIASVMLSIRQPFRQNDLVEIEGDQGKVVRLTSRATILLSLDGNHIRIPNATVFKARIVNFTRNDERRFQFDLTLPPGTDLARARKLAQETVQALPFTLETPAASAWIETMTETGAVLRVTGWLLQHRTDFALARSEAMRLVKDALDRDRPEREARRPPAPTAPAAVAPEGSDTGADDVLDRFAETERATSEDLLKRGAPEE
jgi:small-conductance mechanosensitive channel